MEPQQAQHLSAPSIPRLAAPASPNENLRTHSRDETELPIVFGMRDQVGLGNTRPYYTAIVAKRTNDRLQLLRPIPAKATLEVMVPDARRMAKSVFELETKLLTAFGIPKTKVAAVFWVACVGRYRAKEKLGFELNKAIRAVVTRFPNSSAVGVFMDGELGVDATGRVRFNNWSVSELILADAFQSKADLFRVARALADHAGPRGPRPTLNEALRLSLACVREAGYPGAMISLVFDDGDGRWIVGLDAFGRGWKEIVLPRTRRKSSGTDILAVATKEGPKFIANAQIDARCDTETAVAAGVVSFYAYPLRADLDQSYGVIQFDCGDERHAPDLPLESKAGMDALGSVIGAVICLAIQAERLQIVERLDKLEQECYRSKASVRNGICAFAVGAAAEIGCDVHVRFLHRESATLELIGGNGPYFECAKACRPKIWLNDPSPTAAAYRSGKPRIVNDAVQDEVTMRFVASIDSTDARLALERIRAHANFPILHRGELVGLICFSSSEKCFFTQPRLGALSDIGMRLRSLLEYLQQQEEWERTLRELEFFRKIALPIEERCNVHQALQRQISLLQIAATAKGQESASTVVSCYLFDDFQERYVLRAQAGWKDDSWVDAAWYRRAENAVDITSAALCRGRAEIVEDPRDRLTKLPSTREKYWNLMFGSIDPEDIVEMMVLPLQPKGEQTEALGVVTLQRKRGLPLSEHATGFAITDPKTLEDAARVLSACVGELYEYNKVRWQEQEESRHRAVEQTLHQHHDKSLSELLQAFCDSVVENYRFRSCVVHGSEHGKLEIKASKYRSNPNQLRKIDPDEYQRALQQEEPIQLKSAPAVNPDDPIQVRSESMYEGFLARFGDYPELAGLVEFRWICKRPTGGAILPHHDLTGLCGLRRLLGQAITSNSSLWERRRNEWLRVQQVRLERWLLIESAWVVSGRTDLRTHCVSGAETKSSKGYLGERVLSEVV